MISDLPAPTESLATSGRFYDDRAAGPFSFVNESLISRHIKRAVAISAVVCVILFIAAILAFPEMQDGYLLLALKEQGPGALLHAHLQGPLAEGALFGLAQASGVYFWPLALVLNGLLWIAFGILSCCLWIRLFPDESGYAPFIACLTVAPIVLTIQATTLGVAGGLVGAILGYCSLLLIMQSLHGGAIWLYRVGLLLVPVSILFSADAVAVALVSVTLIMSELPPTSDASHRIRLARRAVIGIVVLSILSYLVYPLLGSGLSDPSGARHTATGWVVFTSLPLTVITQAWHATIGAYGTLIGSFTLTWSAFLALLFAALFSWFLTSRITETRSSLPDSLRKPQRLIVALLVALTFLALRHTSSGLAGLPREADSASQFLLPVMPVAATLTALALLSLVRQSVRPFVLAVLGLLIGFTLFSYTSSGLRRQQTLSALGAAVKSTVGAADANVFGVLSTEDLCSADYSCTAKATSHWPADLSKHFWLFKPSEALGYLGSRRECKSNSQLSAGNPVIRSGPISRLLWIQTSGANISIEPYCLADAAAGAGSAHLAAAPAKIAKGVLTASFNKPTGTQNLTELGPADWAYWTSPAIVNHKSSGSKQIFYYNTVGGVVRDYADHPFAFSWTDGAPTLSELDARTGLSIGGMGHGFQIAAPADATQRKLSVYIGARKTQGKIQAHLGDGSAPDFTDMTVNGSSITAGMYTFVYRAGSLNQLLIVTYTQAANNPQASISLQGAALAIDGAQ